MKISGEENHFSNFENIQTTQELLLITGLIKVRDTEVCGVNPKYIYKIKIKFENLKWKLKTDIKSKFRHKIERFLNLLKFSDFDFRIFNFKFTFSSLWKSFSKLACISMFLEWFSYFMNIIYRRFHLRGI